MKIEQSLVTQEGSVPATIAAYDSLPVETNDVDTEKGQWAPYIYFHSQKSEKALAVMQRYPQAAEGDAFLMADQDIIFLRPGWLFAIVAAHEYQIMRDSSGQPIEVRKLASGARPDDDFREEITAVTLTYSEDTGIVPTVTQWRSTKCGAVRSAIRQQRASMQPAWVDNPGIGKDEKKRRAQIAKGFSRDWMRVWSIFDPGKQKMSKSGNAYRIASSRSQSVTNDIISILADPESGKALAANIGICLDQYKDKIARLFDGNGASPAAPATQSAAPTSPQAPVADSSLDSIPF